MKITNTPGYKEPAVFTDKVQKTAKEKQQSNAKESNGNVDMFVPSEKTETLMYKRPASKPDVATIHRLKEESERTYAQLKELVRQLLEQQGMSFRDLFQLREADVDEATRLEAAQLIGEGGPLHPEAVSDRIVEFARALSGGNKEKIAMLRTAIEKGFAEAAKALGTELPNISQQTYSLVMEKLDAWEKE